VIVAAGRCLGTDPTGRAARSSVFHAVLPSLINHLPFALHPAPNLRDILILMHHQHKFRAIPTLRLKFAVFPRKKRHRAHKNTLMRNPPSK
jgi:hypothetical protein